MSGASKRRKKREAWFRIGADAARRIGLAERAKALVAAQGAYYVDEDGTRIEDFYVCPLCTKALTPWHLRHDEVTLEHVPPDSMSGHEMVLTCKSCNDRSGYTFDAQLRALEENIDFGRGTMQRTRPGKITIGAHSLNVDIHSEGNQIDVRMDERRNHPEQQRAALEIMKDMIDQGTWRDFTFTLTPRGFHYKLAMLSLLRAGYLAAFAALGYRYIFHPELRLVRQQLRESESEILKGFVVSDPTQPRTGNTLIWSQEPDWLDALLVRVGRHTVVLPGLGNPAGFYARLAERLAEVGPDGNLNMKISGKQLPWPIQPTHTFDY
jgi:hypothetical protein